MTLNNATFDICDGDKPYLFVSYSHADEKVVFPLLQGIQEAGFRIWMDRGIEIGTEWSNNIADRLSRCEAVLFFVSKSSVQSENCLDEIACAKSHKKTAILIFIEEDVVLPGGVEMQTARFQRMYATRHASMDSFMSALTAAPIMQACREVLPAPAAEPTPAAEPAPAAEPVPAPTVVCPRCSAKLPVGTGFCVRCGASLTAPAAVPPQPVQQPMPQPVQQPFAPPVPPARPKKKLTIGIVIAIVVAVVLMITVIANVWIAEDEDRVYSVNEVVAAFEGVGYEMSIDPDGYDFAVDSDAEFVESTTAYMGLRTVDGLEDEVYIIYADCTSAETAKTLYDAMVENCGAYDEQTFGENWRRSVFYDEEYGETLYVSMHEDIVLLSGADYFDYVLEERYYDEKLEMILNLMNF